MTAIGAVESRPRAPAKRIGGRHLLQRVALYGMSRGTAEVLLGVRGIVLARELGPAAFGGWALLRLSMRYAGYADLGIFRGVEVELLHAPADSAGDLERERVARSTLGYILTVFGCLAALGLGASFVVADPTVAVALRGFGAAILADEIYTYGLIYLRIAGRLRSYAMLEVIHAALQVVFTTVLAWRFGLPGALAGLVIASTLSIIVTPRSVPRRPMWHGPTIRRLLKIGLPVLASMLLGTALSSGDRWVVAAIGGTSLLGYYAFAGSVAGLAGTLAAVIRTVIFPDVYGRARDDGAAAALRTHMGEALLPFARLYPPILGAIAFAIGPVVALLLPRYLPAVAPARLFILAGAAAGLGGLGALGIMAARRERVLPLYSGAALVLELSLALAALYAGLGLEAVAAASLLGQSLFAGGILLMVAREGGDPRPWQLLARAFLPLAWCVAAVAVLGRIFPGVSLRSAVQGELAYLVAMIPLIPILRRAVRRVTR